MNQAASSLSGDGAWDLAYAYYDDPSAWDITTATYIGNFNVSSQETGLRNVFFKPDGTKMYIIGVVGDDVNEYDLSVPWKVSTASYSQNFSVSSQLNIPQGLFFRSDGTKMYACGNTGRVHEYNLSTAWDVTSAVYSQDNGVSTSNIASIFFKDDGSKMYFLVGSIVHEYNLSTAWDVSTQQLVQTFSVVSAQNLPQGLSFKPDGTRMFIIGNTNDDIDEWTLSTPWDISSAVYLRTFSVATLTTNPRGIFFAPNGGYMYVTSTTAPCFVAQYVLGGFSINAQETLPASLFFKHDGTKMYIIGTTGDIVFEYDLITPWYVPSAELLQRIYVGAKAPLATSLFFKPDGTKMYVCGSSSDSVHEYNLSIPWNVSSSVFSQSFSVASQDNFPTGISFKYDGTKMYVVGNRDDDINEYNLSTAWDISTSSYSQNFSVANQETIPRALSFDTTGTRMYVTGTAGDDINQYSLSTAWDVTSASFLQLFNHAHSETTPSGMFFKPDGRKLFTLGSQRDKVFTHSIGFPSTP